MASISSTNVNEILPGLEDFLRSMLSTAHLNTDHRQIASMYLDKLHQHSQSTTQQTSYIDDQSLMNTDIISDEESDDFTDEDEEQQTPTITRQPSIYDQQLYESSKQDYNMSNCQQYTDVPKNNYLEPLFSNGHHENSSSIISNDLYTTTPSSSTIIADGLLLTYDKNHNWIWRYYVLDDFDLICFPADKKSQSIIQGQSDNTCSPLWVSDITNAKVHTTVIDGKECLCLYIGLAEAIYVRPSDPNQISIWLKAFRDAAFAQKSKDDPKNRRNIKTLSRNARRMFAQFNRKKGQLVSHLLDQMANVTGVDDKTRKHCELRGFLVISFDNSSFVTKYCTIVEGIFRIHKSRLSEQTDHEIDLHRCTLSFPEERTRDIQFALINGQIGTIFIRGNNIYSMGRLLNTLAKYVEITGSSKSVFQSNQNGSIKTSPLLRANSSPQSNGVYSSPNLKSLPATIYRSASKLHDERMYNVPTRQSSIPNDKNKNSIQQETVLSNDIYERPKSYDNLSPVDRNNNYVSTLPKPKERRKNENTYAESRSATNLSQSHRNYSPDRSSLSSSRADPVFCIRSPISTLSQHRASHRQRRPHPLPRRTSLDYMNKLTNLFTRNSNERQPTTPLNKVATPSSHNSNRIQPSTTPSKPLYDIPISIERPAKFSVPAFESYQKPTYKITEDTIYDNVTKSDGIGTFRFVIPFNHSPQSAFTTIKPMNSPSNSTSSTTSSNSIIPQTSSSSNSSNANTNNNNNNITRIRLMTAV